MSNFGADAHGFFDGMYDESPPWDIGGPQPALVTLLESFPPGDPVLDVGCGSGDLAIWLAQQGLSVLGIDFVETAIQRATAKGASLPSEVAQRLRFQVADALQPSRLGRQFEAVVDSAFYHLFDPDQGRRFADELASVLIPGGRCYLLEFAVDFELPNTPRAITEEELRAHFPAAKGWECLSIRPAEFQSHHGPVPAIAACIARRMSSGSDGQGTRRRSTARA